MAQNDGVPDISSLSAYQHRLGSLTAIEHSKCLGAKVVALETQPVFYVAQLFFFSAACRVMFLTQLKQRASRIRYPVWDQHFTQQ